MYISRHVHFDKNVFPYAKHPPSTPTTLLKASNIVNTLPILVSVPGNSLAVPISLRVSLSSATTNAVSSQSTAGSELVPSLGFDTLPLP